MVGRPRTVSDEAIIAAAGRAIARHGPARLTLAHVAAEVGITPAALLQRFGSKHRLLVAVAASGVDAVADVFAVARSAQRSPIAALQTGLAGMVDGIDDPETLANHLAFLQLDLVDPDLRSLAVRHGREMLREIGALLGAAIAAGDLVAVEVEPLARAVYTTYSGALLSWALVGDRPLATWLRREVDLLLAPYRPARSAGR